MINIVSRAVVSRRTTGPKKVVDNLIKGLEQLGYPYVLNAQLDACSRLWIHDDPDALAKIGSLSGVHVIVGPNLYVLPEDIPGAIDLSQTLYVHPSSWVTRLWKQAGFTSASITAWPVGIDTDIFTPSVAEKEHVLVYFKKRELDELSFAETVLKELSIRYTVVRYGSYDERSYQDLLKKSRYVLWIGCPESQGIGLEEALAADVPVLAWDSFGAWDNHRYPGYVAAGATSVPYFDHRCGSIVREKGRLKDALQRMEEALPSYSPRDYVLENLSLPRQARAFVDLYGSHFGLSYGDGLSESRRARGVWKNARLSFFVYQLAKDAVKRILQGTPFAR